jgi:2-polyprenyl-3-methyl-5-hydroxy-6-metoxy-1,4-benzoquinol methylase
VSNPNDLASAHQAWDRTWTNPEQNARWLQPETTVAGLVPLLRERGFSRVLDVGCGLGRHAHYLAAQGFTCAGIDASESGLDYARSQAATAGLSIDYRVGAFYVLPFGDASFDALIAWNVIYHGDRDIARQAIREFARVLAAGGVYVGTMLSKRNRGFGVGREVRPDTFVVDNADDDKVHPHLYVSGSEVLELHVGFEVRELRDVERAPGTNHWEFTFERLAA